MARPTLFLIVILLKASLGLRPACAEEIRLDLKKAPFAVSHAVTAFSARSPALGVMEVSLVGGLEDHPGRAGELTFALAGTPLAARPWSDRSTVSAKVRVSAPFIGSGKRNWHQSHRARLFVEDAAGKRQFLPYAVIVDRPTASDGWIALSGRPTASLPMPLGHTDDGFDANRIAKLGVSVEAFNREREKVTGPIELRDLAVTFGPVVTPAVLPADANVRAGESERARKMEARWRARFGAKPGLVAGVNLAWPSARSPEGETMQLYGRALDAGAPWWGTIWDLGAPAVSASVRADFRAIRNTFGARALVRIFLFGDLRQGIAFADDGAPVEITARAKKNMATLLRLAKEERVVLIPVLLDFTMADGTARSGPDGKWATGEHVDLVTDGAKRVRLAKLLGDFVRPFAQHESVLVWEVMNEPENAAAVVTAEHFADLQKLLAAVTDEIHAAGELATIGHRNVVDSARFLRGRVATDLGQAHYYPLVETRPNPTPFGIDMTPVFGPLPAGWGEAQALPGRIADQLAQARRAGHRFLLFWSWRGDEESGDGFAVRPYAQEITRALRAEPAQR